MKIAKNYFYNMSYQIFLIMVPILTIPYVSRAIGVNGVGINAYTNSIMSYFVLIANYGLSLYGNRTIAYYRDDKYQVSKKFWEIFFAKLIMMTISIIFFMVYISIFHKYRYFLLLQGIQIIAVGFDISWFFVGIEDFKRTVTRNFLVKITSVVFIFTFVHTKGDLGLYILILAGSIFLGNLTLWTYIQRYLIRVDFNQLKVLPILKSSSSLFFPAITATLFISFNRILLGKLSTFTQTGFFDNSDKIVRVFLALLTALGTVVFPRIANHFKKGEIEKANEYVKVAFSLVSCISLPLVGGIILVANPFSSLFYGHSFDGINKVLTVLSVELIFMGWSSIIGQQYMVAIGKTMGLTFSMLISFVICIGISYMLIPEYGAIGAAIVSVLGEAIMLIIQLYVVRNIISVTSLFEEVWKYLLSTVVMVVVCLIPNRFFFGQSDIVKLLITSSVGVLIYILMLMILKPKTLFVLKEKTKL